MGGKWVELLKEIAPGVVRIMPGRFPATSLLASVVIPTRQKVLDVKSRLMTCAYILERISSRSPQ